jgi:hypothetical protein
MAAIDFDLSGPDAVQLWNSKYKTEYDKASTKLKQDDVISRYATDVMKEVINIMSKNLKIY